MNNILKYGVFVFVAVIASFFYLKPILQHEGEYRVVVVNTSERPVSHIEITGKGIDKRVIGPLHVGDMQDYYFIPSQDGDLLYSVSQDKQKFNGIIKANLKKNEEGKIYVVVGEMHQVKIYNEYDAAY